MRRAIVVGASVAGSLCARVLASRADEVAVVERDHLGSPGARRAVPQGGHVHALWYSGLSAMGELHPGLVEELVAGGATPGDVGLDFGWWQLGRRRAPVRTEWQGVTMTRPLLEATLRAGALSQPNVRLLAGQADGLTVTGGRVDGVLVSAHRDDGDGGPSRIPADLVVDCSGRASQLSAWLASLGYVPPEPIQVRMEMGYASRLYRRQPGTALSDGTMGLAALAALPEEPRATVAVAVEGDRWLVGASSYGADRPRASEEDFLARCASSRVGPLDDLLADAEPLSEVTVHRMPTSLRRDYATMARLPAGLLVAGDAVASFNPVYAQGMTCAALHARALRDHLDRGDPSSLAYLRQVGRVTDRAWALAVSEDFRLTTTTGPRPAGTALRHRVGTAYANAARVSPDAHRRFLQVAAMDRPATDLLRPSALYHLVRASLAVRAGKPGTPGSAASAGSAGRARTT